MYPLVINNKIFLLLFMISFLSAADGAEAPNPAALSNSLMQNIQLTSPEIAKKTFADLLKIPLEAPQVSVAIRATTEEEGLIIEDITWESLDHEYPLALVIHPAKAKTPLSAIICLHGSSGSRESIGDAFYGEKEWFSPAYQTKNKQFLGWARELARKGFMTLSLTQRGLDIRKPDTNDQAKDLLVRGRTLMGAIVYEIRQAVTYLQQRKDVDQRKIGATGLSFGGITSFYTWLVDDRVSAAAPICGGVGSVDVFLRVGSRGYHGFYWWIPNMLTYGDQGDFAAALAPKPLMIWAPLNDIGMPKAGVDRFLEVARPAYEKAHDSEALVVHRPPGEHRFSPEAFDAMVKFFKEKFDLE